MNNLSKAAADVLAERRRQIEVEGWTSEHDDQHRKNDLAAAGMSYAMAAAIGPRNGEIWWPWDRKWFKPSSPRKMLVKAGALIIAAIERIDRDEGGE